MKTPHNPPSVAQPFGAYSHGLSLPAAGRLLVTSGQLGIAADGVIPDDIEGQAVLCFEAIKAILADAGMDFGDVIRINGFVTRAKTSRSIWRYAIATPAPLSRCRHWLSSPASLGWIFGSKSR